MTKFAMMQYHKTNIGFMHNLNIRFDNRDAAYNKGLACFLFEEKRNNVWGTVTFKIGSYDENNEVFQNIPIDEKSLSEFNDRFEEATKAIKFEETVYFRFGKILTRKQLAGNKDATEFLEKNPDHVILNIVRESKSEAYKTNGCMYPMPKENAVVLSKNTKRQVYPKQNAR